MYQLSLVIFFYFACHLFNGHFSDKDNKDDIGDVGMTVERKNEREYRKGHGRERWQKNLSSDSEEMQ